MYLHSGNDRIMRQGRESYFSDVIPQLLVNRKEMGALSADFNCVIDKKDALKNPEQKVSPGLKRLVQVFSLKDSFRTLHPEDRLFSR